METSLHRTLKERYATGRHRPAQVTVKRFRIDAVDEDRPSGRGPVRALGPLRVKLRQSLPDDRIRIVKPVILKRRSREVRTDRPVVSALQSKSAAAAS